MDILRALNDVSSDLVQSFDEKINQLLQIGCDALQMEVGVITQKSPLALEVVAVSGTQDGFKLGDALPLNDSYCVQTINQQGVVAYHNTQVYPGTHHPCYQRFGFGRYIGIPLVVDARQFGAIGFFAAAPAASPFDETAKDQMILLAEWIGAAYSRQQFLEGLQLQQQQLAHQSQLFDQVAQLAGVGSWEYDIVRDEMFWSEPLRQMYELPRDFEVSTEQAFRFISEPQQRDQVWDKFSRMMETGQGFSTEIEVESYTGRRFWIQAQCKVTYKNDQPDKVIGATQDITSRVLAARELEQKHRVAEQALQSRSLFLANMSHEIRTPINGVIGMLDAMSKTSMDSQQQEFCNVASSSANTLLGLINDILDFSKIDSGQINLEQVPVDISALIREQQSVFEHVANEKGLSLSIDTEQTDALWFMADPVRIKQILTNLINNAIKFTAKGSVKVRTRALEQSNGKYLVQLIVEDTGIGIEPDRQAAIFSPFQQGDSATTRRFGGTGLGLSIVAQIAEHMGGGIRVKSTPGEGASFIVGLQLNRTSDTQPQSCSGYAEEDQAQPLTAELTAGRRLMVVEDNDINQVVIAEQLKELGIEADLVQNGGEAVEQFIRSQTWESGYDLILMDCQMPVMDGYEATAAIRKLGGYAQTVPIIALTANALAGEREKCVLAGMNDYLTKPVSVEKLGKCIRRYLIGAYQAEGGGI